jgi:hypothetical protein
LYFIEGDDDDDDSFKSDADVEAAVLLILGDEGFIASLFVSTVNLFQRYQNFFPRDIEDEVAFVHFCWLK